MTILASDLITEQLLKRMQVITPEQHHLRDNRDLRSWVNEFRTLTIELPRQTLKTSTLIAHMAPRTALVVSNLTMKKYTLSRFASPEQWKGNVFTTHEFISTLHPPRRTPRFDGQFLRIFTDELNHTARYELVDAVATSTSGILSEDCFILHVGTPRC